MFFIARKISTYLSIFFPNDMSKIIKNEKKIIKLVNRHLIYLSKQNLKKTHRNFNIQLYKFFRKGNLCDFLRISFIQKMFFVHNRLFILRELNYLKKSNEWNIYKKLLIEDNVGNPIRYFLYPQSSGNRINHVYHLSLINKYLNIKLKDINNVFEFGGGYGCMARIFYKINKNIKYSIFDTKLVNLLQLYYLKHNQMNVGFKNNNQFKLISNLKKYNSTQRKKSLFIANWSLSETPINLRNKIEPIISKFHYVMIAFQENFEDINNKKYFNKIKKKLEKKYIIKIILNNYYKGNLLKKQNHFFFLAKRKI